MNRILSAVLGLFMGALVGALIGWNLPLTGYVGHCEEQTTLDINSRSDCQMLYWFPKLDHAIVAGMAGGVVGLAGLIVGQLVQVDKVKQHLPIPTGQTSATEQSPAEKHCPQCGAVNTTEHRFCGICGTPLPVPKIKPKT